MNLLVLFLPDCAGFAVNVRLCEPDGKPFVKYCVGMIHKVELKASIARLTNNVCKK